eukprot:TRINITY_DN7213_c0_g1_i1.p1 TRINITY_DN7213_c0_g1~~TRINITY_DN7213_c0_g1_i1.p1  ORF type:complete len:131 (-),score=21.02 TRINITY_DN7213_c0_g1_i1:48-440(-)
MSFNKIIANNTHEVKICGMNQQLLNKTRNIIALVKNNQLSPDDAHTRYNQIFTARINNPSISLDIIVGTVGGDIIPPRSSDFATVDLISVLLLDPLDIDSKQMTFVNKRLDYQFRANLWDALYRFDGGDL